MARPESGTPVVWRNLSPEPPGPAEWIDRQGVGREERQRFLRHVAIDAGDELWRRFVAERHGTGVGMDGAAFVTERLHIEPVWGLGDDVLIAQGEPTCIVGPQGVGKSTLAQQVVLARLGLNDGSVLEYPVEEGYHVLYLALDRPPQIARSLARMLDGDDALRTVKEGLRVWRGALPVEPSRHPELFAEWVQDEGDQPDMVVVDSYKDVGGGALSDEDVAFNINRASQLVCLAGTEWVGLHHHRKATAGNARPQKLDDVYGSTWLTSGCGSVILLWGEPGAARVELRHLKQPMSTVGPLLVDHEHGTGISGAVEPDVAVERAVVAAGDRGLTEPTAAITLYGSGESSDRKRARRVLDRLVNDGVLRFEPGTRGGSGGGGRPARWWST